MSAMLETTFIGNEVNILPNIDAVNMDPEACLEEYGHHGAQGARPLQSRDGQPRGEGLPPRRAGHGRVGMLGKALYHVKEKRRGRPPRYDLVILDAPATGHGLQMLRVPQVIVDVAPPGLLRREAEDASCASCKPLRPKSGAWWW
jgi:anion-transporting  ArsA/GET3 family ATPase